MKIAITGHTAGIGQALANVYAARGHEIVGLSRRSGYNIKIPAKILEQAASCDMFISNAQAGFAQVELLYKLAAAWQGQRHKRIMVISTASTLCPVSPQPGLGMDEYRTQKVALEEAARQLAWQNIGPRLLLVKPGGVATQPGDVSPWPAADVNEWATKLVDCIELVEPNLEIVEITLLSKDPTR
jgi:NAD(P)-dependent dehydrogenase (short-subunit alcohol dehydrogenase family)